MRRHVLARALLASFLVIPAVASATKPAKPDEPQPGVGAAAADKGAFFASVSVDIVNVDVFVTDKSGNPIGGLGQADFDLREDGHPVAISNFYAVDERQPRPPAMPVVAPPVPAPGVAPPAAVEATPEEQRLYLIVYIDNFNIKPFNRNRVFRGIREFLNANVRTDDKVMLVTYNRSFKERVAFTSDPTLVNSTLFDIEKETGYGVHRESDRADALQAVEDATDVSQAMAHVRGYAGSLFNDTEVSIDAIRDLVASLGGLPGRKAILYVSEGLPMVAAEDVFLALNEKFHDQSMLMQSREYDASRRFQELTAQANGNRVTFYTIDAGGLRTFSSSSAERQTAGAPGSAAFIDSQNIFNIQSPLLMMAQDTGGRAIINTNDVGPRLAEVARDLRSYYSLGYQPAHSGDGRYHTIEVKVKRKGLQVRNRSGYRDKPIEQRMTDATMAALLFGELGNPFALTLHFGAPQMREDGNALVPIHLRIPLDKVTLIAQQQNQEAHLRAFIAVMDHDGGISPVSATPIVVQIPAAELAAARLKGWGYDVTLLMRQGEQRVAIGLRDDLGGATSFISGAITVR